MSKKQAIAPQLFEGLVEYAEGVKDEKDRIEPISGTSPLLTFCEQFFLQFFDNVVGHDIEGVGPHVKPLSVRLRKKLAKSGASRERIRLMLWFEKLCDDYYDLLYASSTATHDFYENYVATLLDRIAAWADADGLKETARIAGIASKRLNEVMQS